MPTNLLPSLLHFRMRLIVCPTTEHGICALCHLSVPDYHHLFFRCPHLAPATQTFMTALSTHLPSTHATLTDLIENNHEGSVAHIQRTAKATLQPNLWKKLIFLTAHLTHTIAAALAPLYAEMAPK
jgi:hypothetical protein